MERLSLLSKQFGPNPLSSTKKPTLTVTDSRNGTVIPKSPNFKIFQGKLMS